MLVRWCVVLVVLLCAAACGSSGEDDAGEGEVSVFAAASLATAFADITTAFEDQSSISVQLNIASSSTLREQILAGAPVDVFASANETVMDAVVNAGEANQPQVFATNSLVIGVPAGNPAEIVSLADFELVDLLLGTCAAGVPCGDAANQVFSSASINPELDTAEPDVRALVTKLAEGELDGGIVYRTDVIANNEVDSVALSESDNVLVAYPIAPINRSTNRDGAVSFIDFVFSDEGQQILTDHGFGTPAGDG